MPPDGNAANASATSHGVLMPDQCEPTGRDAHGVEATIRELAAPPQKPLTPNPEYARFPRYVGTVGGRQIEMRFGAKTGSEGKGLGLHGEY